MPAKGLRLDDLTAKYGFSALEQRRPSELVDAVEALSTEVATGAR